MELRNAVELKQSHWEKSVGKSLTQPDQTISVREILHRYTTGQSLDVNANMPVYTEGHSLYDVRRKHNIDIAMDRYQHERFMETIEQNHNELIQRQVRLQTVERNQNQSSKTGENMGQQTQKVHTEPPTNS